MTKKTRSKEELLFKLGTLKLKQYPVSKFKRWMVDEDDKSIWKNRKIDTVVNAFYVAVFETWRNNLICRTFYVCQMWWQKEKETRVFEVKRQLSGCSKQLIRRLYSPCLTGGIKCWIYDDAPWYYREERCSDDWQLKSSSSFNLATANNVYYGGSYLVDNWYILNDKQEIINMLWETDYKYSGFEYSDYGYHEIFDYLLMYDKHPAVEMIVKIGLGYLIREDKRTIRWRRKGLAILGIEKKDVSLLRKLKIPLADFRKNKKYIYKFGINKIDDYYCLVRLIEISKIKYARINISKFSLDYFKHQGYSNSLLARDYYRFCEELGIPMTHENRYPTDMKSAHDKLSAKIEARRNPEFEAMIIDRVNKSLSKYRYTDEDLLITPANSIEDLINESKELHHCVRTYYKRYAKGETSIFLIRQCSEPNKPYFTLELKGKKVEQLRGEHNCIPTLPVVNFANKWANNFNFKGYAKGNLRYEMG